MRKILLFCFLLIASLKLLAQVPDFRLNRTFGKGMKRPADIEVDKYNFMYVLDTFEEPGINKLDPTGEVIKTIPIQQGHSPSALALDKAGNMFVLIEGKRIVQKYSPEGAFLLEFGTRGQDSSEVMVPKDLDVDEEGNVYVADPYNYQHQKFSSQGKWISAFSIPGVIPGTLDRPVAVKVSHKGNLFTLTESYKILKTTAAGQFIDSFQIKVPNFRGITNYNATIALDDAENIYVSDLHEKSGKTVHKISASGQYLYNLGPGQLNSGWFTGNKIGLAVGPQGDLFTSDHYVFGTSSIQVFDAAGRFKKKMAATETYSALQQDKAGNQYVVSTVGTRSVIKVINPYGVQIGQIGSDSDAGEQLLKPVSIALDDKGQVYTLEKAEGTANTIRIQKFSPDGRLLARFTDFGDTLYWHANLDLALDSRGNIYLSELQGGCIRKLGPDGKFSGKIIGHGPEPGKVMSPTGLTIDAADNIYVADSAGYRLQKFNSSGQFLMAYRVPFFGNPNGDPPASLSVDLAGNVYMALGWGGHIHLFNKEGERLGLIPIPADNLSVNGEGTRIVVSDGHLVKDYRTGEVPPVAYLTGMIFQDKNLNCRQEAGEKPLSGILVKAEPGSYYGISDELGAYTIPVDTGTYTLSTILPQEAGRVITPNCPAAFTQSVKTGGYGSRVPGPDFGNQVSTAPVLQVAVSSDRRRRCFRNFTTLMYANTGFAPAANAKVTVQLPEFVSFISASKPYTKDAKGNYVFALGDLAPNQRGSITLVDSVSCADPGIRGLTVCTKAWISPANTYPAPANWNKAEISVSGKIVEQGQARFVIRNVGTGHMTDSLFFRVYQEGELALQARYHLAVQDSLVLRFAPTGRMVRVEVDQPEGHPLKATAGENVEVRHRMDNSQPSLLMMAYPPDDPEPEIALDCLPIIDSFDPNDKQVVPAGIGPEHYTPTNTPLRYTVRFQNTGTDLAYRVVVVDTLAADLDLSTLQVGAFSHPCRWSVTGKTRPVLTFTFDNIMLPDSARDQAGSNGFVQFSIKPKSQLAEKTAIENYADIFFDYNEPVRTNATLNRIYDMPREVKETARLSSREVVARPAISSFSPAKGRAGSVVTLKGRHFAPTAVANQVLFNGVAATVQSASDSVLTVQVPAKAFTGNIQVTTPDGMDYSRTAFTFIPAPEITAFSPAHGHAGATITISGRHFNADGQADTVYFNDLPAKVIQASEALLEVQAPKGVASGTITVAGAGGRAVAAGFVVPDLKPEEAIVIYPNPTKVGITINWLKAGFTLESVQVFNAIGMLVAEIDTSSAEKDELSLPLSRFGPGIYLVQIRTSAGPVMKRVVVL